MIVYPNAKINLGLNIVERRNDGYHNIETAFYPIALSDMLDVTLPENSKERWAWEQTGLMLDVPPSNNICIRALTLLGEHFDLPTIGLHLHKIIPFGAGLGGGSADAAFTLKTVNALCGLGLSNAQLKQMAAQIGADCPFFIDNKPMMAEGIGDVLSPIDVNLSGKHITLVKPNVFASTKEAYSRVIPQRPKESIADIVSQPIEQWRGRLKNDFEDSLFALYPIIGQIKEELYDAGALYASMSGSGSSVFGIFDEQSQYTRNDCFVWRGILQ